MSPTFPFCVPLQKKKKKCHQDTETPKWNLRICVMQKSTLSLSLSLFLTFLHYNILFFPLVALHTWA